MARARSRSSTAASSKRSKIPQRRAEEQAALEEEYADRFLNPYIAAERGFVDEVIAAPTLVVRSPARSARLAHQARACDQSPSLEHSALATENQEPAVLQGKRILVTGVLNDASIAFSVARIAQEQGAEVVLSSFGRVMRLTERVAKRLPDPDVQLVELDVTSQADLDGLADAVGGNLDGVVHSLGFAPESCLGGGFLDAPWDDVAVALQISAYSLKALAAAALPLMSTAGRSSVSTSTTTTPRGPSTTGWASSKAAFESVARYLARDLGPQGIRVNLVTAGPIRSIAAKSIPGFEAFEEVWAERGAARVGRQGRRARREGRRRAALGLVPRHHR